MSIHKFIEPLIWSAALLLLFFMNPASTGSFCIAKLLGLNGCFGCGIGHAIHHTLHFQFMSAWKEHFMGVPATLLIIYRILQTFTKTKNSFHHGSATAYDVKRSPAG